MKLIEQLVFPLPGYRFLVRPRSPHHFRIGALHGDSEAAAARVLRPSGSSSPLPRAGAC